MLGVRPERLKTTLHKCLRLERLDTGRQDRKSVYKDLVFYGLIGMYISAKPSGSLPWRVLYVALFAVIAWPVSRPFTGIGAWVDRRFALLDRRFVRAALRRRRERRRRR